jgi:hypothetical protein
MGQCPRGFPQLEENHAEIVLSIGLARVHVHGLLQLSVRVFKIVLAQISQGEIVMT